MVTSRSDNTELGQPALATSEGEHQFRQLFARSPDAILLIDPHDSAVSWPIVDCNEAAANMNGYGREELIGKSIDVLNTTRGTPRERAVYLERLRSTLSVDDQDELIRAISIKAQRLQRMLADLLDLDRLTRGVVEPIRTRTDLAALVRRRGPRAALGPR